MTLNVLYNALENMQKPSLYDALLVQTKPSSMGASTCNILGKWYKIVGNALLIPTAGSNACIYALHLQFSSILRNDLPAHFFHFQHQLFGRMFESNPTQLLIPFAIISGGPPGVATRNLFCQRLIPNN